MDNVMRLVDAATLDPRITPEQLSTRYGQDDHAFSLLAVAEAILNRVPAGVTQWLSAPGVRTMWEEVLTVQEGNHQLSWWSKMITFGIEHPDTLRADRRLARIRQRRREAQFIVTTSVDRPVDGRVRDTALQRLKDAHPQETDSMLDELRRLGGIVGDECLSPGAERLLRLSDERFRDLAAQDVQGRADADELRHPAVLARWYDALVELGSQTFEQIGLETEERNIRAWFAVPDRYLIDTRHDASVEDWAPRLTFLTHLRTRLMERGRLRRAHDLRLFQQVHSPLEQRLRADYPDEYVRYRQEEPSSAAAPQAGEPRPPHPAVFSGYAEVLHRHAWDVKWIYDGHRVWLDAWHGDDWRKGGRIVVTAARSRNAGKSSWRWSRPNFVFHNRRSRRYTLLSSAEALVTLAAENPAVTPTRYLKAVVPQVREHLEALIPPDGFRWRHPYPPPCGPALDRPQEFHERGLPEGDLSGVAQRRG
ncbi:hypothetical protein [Streptosporangium sp. NPDC001681]|uniref:hypothetical protein n=1 Tax=Streptosporangium sp. NPDC001681 TaxID=3154395 RepID=UPI00331B0411